ncbi:hypothetical protein CARN8_1580006 [mine drainage metagenome]|uniref:Uncharacterized protein n=1 Tax=mine drainage metagenome TaxID=410659 RepID=A0A3P3ZMH6_9ZZZZ
MQNIHIEISKKYALKLRYDVFYVIMKHIVLHYEVNYAIRDA